MTGNAGGHASSHFEINTPRKASQVNDNPSAEKNNGNFLSSCGRDVFVGRTHFDGVGFRQGGTLEDKFHKCNGNDY
jgi:hypothetical protein